MNSLIRNYLKKRKNFKTEEISKIKYLSLTYCYGTHEKNANVTEFFSFFHIIRDYFLLLDRTILIFFIILTYFTEDNFDRVSLEFDQQNFVHGVNYRKSVN